MLSRACASGKNTKGTLFVGCFTILIHSTARTVDLRVEHKTLHYSSTYLGLAGQHRFECRLLFPPRGSFLLCRCAQVVQLRRQSQNLRALGLDLSLGHTKIERCLQYCCRQQRGFQDLRGIIPSTRSADLENASRQFGRRSNTKPGWLATSLYATALLQSRAGATVLVHGGRARQYFLS